MERAFPLFFLAGGELVLAGIALRIAVWVARGWREFRALGHTGGDGGGPRGPNGGLRVLAGGRGAPEPRASWRRAA